MHDDSILCLAFNLESDYLASGSNDGKLKIWQINTGKCVKKFENAHLSGINSVCFTRDDSQILTASRDQTVKLHGLKSGATLKVFRGHRSFVNDAKFSHDLSKVISVSADGDIKVFNVKSSDCLFTFSLSQNDNLSVLSLQIIPQKLEDEFLICNRSNTLTIINLKGQVDFKKFHFFFKKKRFIINS